MNQRTTLRTEGNRIILYVIMSSKPRVKLVSLFFYATKTRYASIVYI